MCAGLSLADAKEIIGAALPVIVAAWGYRLFIRLLKS